MHSWTAGEAHHPDEQRLDRCLVQNGALIPKCSQNTRSARHIRQTGPPHPVLLSYADLTGEAS
jgi:hypothetical protein